VVKLAVAIGRSSSLISASPGFDSRPMHFCLFASLERVNPLVLLMGRGHGMLGGDGKWPCNRSKAVAVAAILSQPNFCPSRTKL
jgi:hypothetical protein